MGKDLCIPSQKACPPVRAQEVIDPHPAITPCHFGETESKDTFCRFNGIHPETFHISWRIMALHLSEIVFARNDFALSPMCRTSLCSVAMSKQYRALFSRNQETIS
jgi:hypothetical protein